MRVVYAHNCFVLSLRTRWRTRLNTGIAKFSKISDLERLLMEGMMAKGSGADDEMQYWSSFGCS